MTKEKLESLRQQYPPGTRIVLDHMVDPQSPSPGTQGFISAIDDIGSLIVHWDTGSHLSVILEDDEGHPLDRIHVIATEEEAKTTLNHIGSKQPEENTICPRCGILMKGKTIHQALSRYASLYVCPSCGNQEGVEVAGLVPKKPLMEWQMIKWCLPEFLGSVEEDESEG